ncbi:hypothetical protein RFI_29922, partial [Reticulomyxa filosa]
KIVKAKTTIKKNPKKKRQNYESTDDDDSIDDDGNDKKKKKRPSDSERDSDSDSDSDRLTKNKGASKKRKRESESEDNKPIDPEWDRIFPIDETKDPEPLALTNSNEVEQIAMKGELKMKKAIECIQVHSRLAVFKDDFKYKDQVDSEIKTYCLNLQQAAVEIFKTY